MLLRSAQVRAEDGYSLPAEIAAAVYLVGNLNEFPDVRSVQLAEPTEASEPRGLQCRGCLGSVLGVGWVGFGSAGSVQHVLDCF